VNLAVATFWVGFTWRALLVCEIFTAVLREFQRIPHIVL